MVAPLEWGRPVCGARNVECRASEGKTAGVSLVRVKEAVCRAAAAFPEQVEGAGRKSASGEGLHIPAYSSFYQPVLLVKHLSSSDMPRHKKSPTDSMERKVIVSCPTNVFDQNLMQLCQLPYR